MLIQNIINYNLFIFCEGYRLKKTKVRPTANIVKQAIFNILYDVSGKRFLDIFAGTGRVGFEALKKGAEEVVFVEKDKQVCFSLKEIAKKYDKNVKIVCSDALSFLKKNKQKFDVIFADPPYDFKAYDKLINLAVSNLNKGGVFILEHRKEKDFDADEKRIYGETAISFWRR